MILMDFLNFPKHFSTLGYVHSRNRFSHVRMETESSWAMSDKFASYIPRSATPADFKP